MSLTQNKVFVRLDEMLSQLEKSWPKTLQSILDKNPYPKYDSFFIYSFPKWDYRGEKPVYNIFHQARLTMPDPFWGTTCRKINKKNSTAEIVWCLPHQEGIKNYGPNKIFGDAFIWKCIRDKKSGKLERTMQEYNEKLEKNAK